MIIIRGGIAIFRKRHLFLTLIVLFVSLLAVSQVSAEDTDNVTLSADSNVDDIQLPEIEDVLEGDAETEYKSFSEIQDKINSANSGDTIHISGSYKGSGIEIRVDRTLTIEGDDDYTYIDADGLSRAFYITASDVVLKNLVIKNCDAGSDNGGAVCCDAEENTRITHCIIGLNTGGYGGATYYCDAYDSIFLKNSATRGGAMYGGNAESCGFANNTASERGGAMYLRDGCTVHNSIFENNTCSDDGGAVYSCAGDNTISNCNFNYNEATGDDGGAIYNNDMGNLDVLNCDLRYNKANDDGGAIYTESDTYTRVKNSLFYSNEAGYWGGAMYGGTASDSYFYYNSADRNGGAMYGGSAYDCTFLGSSPQAVYNTDVYESITGKITLTHAGSYFGGKSVTVKVINTKRNTALSGVPVTFKFSNGKSATVYTGSNGIATYNVPFNPGSYKVTATIPSSYSGNTVSSSFTISKAPATVTPTKLTTKYEVGKYFKVKVINSKSKKAIAGVKLLLKVYTGKKAKKVYVTTGSDGAAYYNTYKLGVGKHKVKISIVSSVATGKAKTSQIKVKKASTKTITPNGIYVYKKADKYYFGVSNKHTSYLIDGIKLKVKVFTGKKAKTYTVKTNKKGIASISTKSLKVGKHKVVVTFKGNKNFKKSSAKGTIEISKKMPTYVGYHYMFTSYSFGYPSGRSINVYVKDMNGKELNHKKITITHSSGAKTTGYTGSMIPIPGGIYGKVVIKFAGDKKYMPSSYTINFV